jgi:hypothetical protein
VSARACVCQCTVRHPWRAAVLRKSPYKCKRALLNIPHDCKRALIKSLNDCKRALIYAKEPYWEAKYPYYEQKNPYERALIKSPTKLKARY